MKRRLTLLIICAGREVTRVNILAGKYCRDCQRTILQATGEVVR